MTAGRSPLDVPGVSSAWRPGELVALVREDRERSGERILPALSTRRLKLARDPSELRGRGRRRTWEMG